MLLLHVGIKMNVPKVDIDLKCLSMSSDSQRGSFCKCVMVAQGEAHFALSKQVYLKRLCCCVRDGLLNRISQILCTN